MCRTELTYRTVRSIFIECKNCIRITARGLTEFIYCKMLISEENVYLGWRNICYVFVTWGRMTEGGEGKIL